MKFKYLGTLFTADADQAHDIKARAAMAMSRCGQLRHIFDSNIIPMKLKIRLYEAAVCSLLTFGCETWTLDDKAKKTLNNANSRMLARITGNTIPQEARPATTSLNIINRIRARRLRWVGHILREGPEKLTYQALKAQDEMDNPGNLLMDTPPHEKIEDLIPLAKDRATWGERVSPLNKLKTHPRLAHAGGHTGRHSSSSYNLRYRPHQP